jgi:hypothetical protein
MSAASTRRRSTRSAAQVGVQPAIALSPTTARVRNRSKQLIAPCTRAPQWRARLRSAKINAAGLEGNPAQREDSPTHSRSLDPQLRLVLFPPTGERLDSVDIEDAAVRLPVILGADLRGTGGSDARLRFKPSQFERQLIRARCDEGIKRAKPEGRYPSSAATVSVNSLVPSLSGWSVTHMRSGSPLWIALGISRSISPVARMASSRAAFRSEGRFRLHQGTWLRLRRGRKSVALSSPIGTTAPASCSPMPEIEKAPDWDCGHGALSCE